MPTSRLDTVLTMAIGSGLLSPRPAVFYGKSGIEQGRVASILSRNDWSADVAMTDSWLGAGLERRLGKLGLFAGYGKHRQSGDYEGRIAATIAF